MRLNAKWRWFAAFTAVFAVMAAIVFWGCWSTDVTFISPDDGVAFPPSYGDAVVSWWNGFLTMGYLLPSDVFWSGLIGSPHFCRELKYVSAVYFAALGLAYFLRGRGLSRLASYGAGLLLAFCGYWLTLFSAGHAGWFVWMTYGVFAFGLIDRALERGDMRHWLLFGAVLAWGSFRQPDLWLLFTAFTFAYFVFRLIALKVFPWKGMSAALAVFLGVGAPSFYHALNGDLASRDQQIEESARTPDGGTVDAETARWRFTTNWSMPPEDTVEFVRARVHGDTSCPFTLSINRDRGVRPYEGRLGRPLLTDGTEAPSGNYRQHSLYVGYVTCFLALFGVVYAFTRRGGVARFFLAAGLVFYVFSLGRYCEGVYRLVYSLPFGDYLRAPVKWHHLTEFSIVVLAGFGLEFLLRTLGRIPSLPRSAAPALLSAIVVFGVADLATEAHRFCVPVDYSKAISSRRTAQLVPLPKPEYNPQIGQLIKAGELVPVAEWIADPRYLLCQYLQPARASRQHAAKTPEFWLGILSVLTALAAVGTAFGCWRRLGLGGGGKKAS